MGTSEPGSHGNSSTNNSGNSQGNRPSSNPFASWQDPVNLSLDLDFVDHPQLSTTLPQSTSNHSQGPSLSNNPFASLSDGSTRVESIDALPFSSSAHRSTSLELQTGAPGPVIITSLVGNAGEHPGLCDHPQMPPVLRSSSTPPMGQSNMFNCTPYQPPPMRQGLQQQQQPNPQLQSQHHLHFSNIHQLEREPASPGASTLVGSPMTPCSDPQHRFSWTAANGSQQPSRLMPFDPMDPGAKTTTQRTSLLGPRSLSTDRLELSKDNGGGRTGTDPDQDYLLSPVSPIDAARSLGDRPSWTTGHSGKCWDQQHIALHMDDISLESFSPSDSPPRKAGGPLASRGNFLYRLGRRDNGTALYQNENGYSSNASMVTLLGQNGGELSTSSSSSTIFGGLLSSSAKAKAGKGGYIQSTLSKSDSFASYPEKYVDTSLESTVPDGKAYSKRPKPKVFGKKGKGGGGGGNGDRKALFSNERLFLHWIKFGILLGSLALTLCNFGELESLAFYVGSTSLMVAMASLGYGTVLFHRRDQSLTRRLAATLARKQGPPEEGLVGAGEKKSINPAELLNAREICYYDRTGPTVLCSMLLLAFGANFYISVTRGDSVNVGGGLGYFQPQFSQF